MAVIPLVFTIDAFIPPPPPPPLPLPSSLSSRLLPPWYYRYSSSSSLLLQDVEGLRKEVESLRGDRDHLEREAARDRAWLYESVHTSKTRLAMLVVELEGVEEELKEVEGDRVYWEAKLIKESVRTELLSQRRRTLWEALTSGGGGSSRVVEKLVYERVKVAMEEEKEVVGVIVEMLAPFLEPEMVVEEGVVVEAFRSVVGGADEGWRVELVPLTTFYDVVDELRGLRWQQEERSGN